MKLQQRFVTFFVVQTMFQRTFFLLAVRVLWSFFFYCMHMCSTLYFVCFCHVVFVHVFCVLCEILCIVLCVFGFCMCLCVFCVVLRVFVHTTVFVDKISKILLQNKHEIGRWTLSKKSAKFKGLSDLWNTKQNKYLWFTN